LLESKKEEEAGVGGLEIKIREALGFYVWTLGSLVFRVSDLGLGGLGCKVPWFQEREFFIDNLLVRIHLIIRMIEVDRPCAMGV
jgi:hypothetical protein